MNNEKIYEYDRLAEITINDMELSIRAINALQASGTYKNLYDLEQASDLDLLAIPNLGKKAVKEIREVTKSIRSSRMSLPEEIMQWASKHRNLITALIKGEAVIVPKH